MLPNWIDPALPYIFVVGAFILIALIGYALTRV